MGRDQLIWAQLIRMLGVLGLAVVLSACAGRPKPLDQTRPYTVTEVQVTARSIGDFGFADRLQQRLEATVGRATHDIGQTATLRVVVNDYGAETGLVHFFDSSVMATSLELTLVDTNTGQVLHSRTLRSTAARRNGQSADTALVAGLVENIQELLGLSGYAPHPVRGIKRTVARPQPKPETVPEMQLLSADPLLNGTVTPTTVDLDLAQDPAPTLDISKPLLTVEPVVPQAVSPVAPSAPISLPQRLEAQSGNSDATTGTAPAESDDSTEPCIITLDNECN